MHRTLGAFFHDLLHGVFHFEGRIWRTLPLLAWRLSGQWGPGVYAVGLAAMAASAWISRFGWSVRLGVLAFVASDLLLFASHGVLAGNMIADLLVMPLYYLGQLAICTGVVRTR